MPAPTSKTLIDLETKFWRSMVSNDTDAALDMLMEPSLMVSPHGAMKFNHADYRRMAEHGSMVVTDFEFSDMEVVFLSDNTAILSYHVKQRVAPRGSADSTVQEMHDTSTWIQTGNRWQCAMHTETPAEAKPSAH
jgi:ketosteroid isomerase-like protein